MWSWEWYLGEWVFANKIDIEVNDYCLSSCANYVFTAGKNKYISNKAIIGFHGGLSSQEFDTSDIEASFKDLPKRQREEEIQKVLHEMQTYIGKTKEKKIRSSKNQSKTRNNNPWSISPLR